MLRADIPTGERMTPEAKARELIDAKLEAAGWVVQDTKQINLGAASGVAVREYPTDTGPADYLLFVDRRPVGVIEAKRDEAGENLTAHEAQTERYAGAQLKWRKDNVPLRFLYEATGRIIHFTDAGDPRPRARELFHFFQPQTLAAWAAQSDTLHGRLIEFFMQAAQQKLEPGALATARENINLQILELVCLPLLPAAFSDQLVPQDPNDEPASMLLERLCAERVSNGARRPARNGRKRKEPA